MARRFEAANWERLVSPQRRELIDPARFITNLGIAPGSTAADIGAGPGFFTIPLAEAVGERGTVHALDVSPDMIEVLLRSQLPPQVRAAVMEENHVPLADGSVDFALLAFVLHELNDPVALLSDIRRTLRPAPAGRLVVLEWIPQEEEMGPPAHERLAPRDARALIERAGFRTADQGMANDSNYYIDARPASAENDNA